MARTKDNLPNNESPLLPNQQLLVPLEKVSTRRSRPLDNPDDYDPPSEDDPDFPSEDGVLLPPVKLTYKLSLNVLSEKQQCEILGWDKKTLKMVNNQTGIFTQMPSVCAGTSGCPYGAICPIENRDAFIGRSCPLEVKELFTHFAGYVKDLDIQPDHFTDIKQVSRLCRQHMIMWRTDMNMKIQPEVVKEVAVIAQKTGKAYSRPAMNKNRELQEKTSLEIDRLLKGLLARREDRLMAQKEGKEGNSMALIFSGLDDD